MTELRDLTKAIVFGLEIAPIFWESIVYIKFIESQ